MAFIKRAYDISRKKVFTCKTAMPLTNVAEIMHKNSVGSVIVKEGDEVKGIITDHPRGENGFGYDPVFFLPEFNKTVAELTDQEKHAVSHRGRAAGVMKDLVKNQNIILS